MQKEERLIKEDLIRRRNTGRNYPVPEKKIRTGISKVSQKFSPYRNSRILKKPVCVSVEIME